MTRLLFISALILGTLSVCWMSRIFWDTNMLAFAVTAIIGCVFLTGIVELFQFRYGTYRLLEALSKITGKVENLNEWLATLTPSLQNPVQMRIENQQIGLPAPILTPYLVGLLVMLGLLGTFIGMVDTLKGAVSALEGTTDLQAIRDGLAAPIKGLGLAFGTSVAGVTTSAMLGLMSTLSRRDRILATRQLDTKIANELRNFSLNHSQKETFKALQVQTQTLPSVAEKLSTLTNKLDTLSSIMLKNQEILHANMKNTSLEFFNSMGTTFEKNISDHIRLANEIVEPVMKKTLNGFAEQTQNIHQRITSLVKDNLHELSRQLTTTASVVSDSWQKGVVDHATTNKELIQNMDNLLNEFKSNFNMMTQSTLESIRHASASWLDRQEQSDHDRLLIWTKSLDETQKNAASHQEKMSKSLETTVNQLVTTSQNTTIQMHQDVAELIKSSEGLIQTRINTEENWLNDYNERTKNLFGMLKSELFILRDEEEKRGQQAVERLSDLETALAQHLTTLGQALEAPMTRLVKTASEAPEAAARVIEQLRQEVSKGIERDNQELEKRTRIMGELGNLSESLTLAAEKQQNAIAQLVDASGQMLDEIKNQFTKQVDSEVEKISGVAENFAVSAVEMASLGEAFGTAVNLFNNSNVNLIENLAQIQTSLDRSNTRSDEQLAYYVAQARQIIDQSMLSQKEIFDELRRFHQQDKLKIESN